jgi:hypothetical protein
MDIILKEIIKNENVKFRFSSSKTMNFIYVTGDQARARIECILHVLNYKHLLTQPLLTDEFEIIYKNDHQYNTTGFME